MSGLRTVAACMCIQHRGACPHCTEAVFTSYAEWAGHIDRCHRASINYGVQPKATYGVPRKSMPLNASHQPIS